MELLLLVAVAAVIVWALLSATLARHSRGGCCQGHRQCPTRQPHDPEEP